MPLIVAIEPDRRQASRITALARDPLNVEVIVTESAEKALVALSKRVPDLILTSLLLSPKDEALLDGRLRELDAAGSNVPTLMIPVLGSAARAPKKEGGLLTRLRRSSDEEPVDGCDPAVFAAQIAEYLERAAAERALAAAVASDAADDAVAPVRAARSEPVRPAKQEVPAPVVAAPIQFVQAQPTEVFETPAAARVTAPPDTAETPAWSYQQPAETLAAAGNDAWQEVTLDDDHSIDSPSEGVTVSAGELDAFVDTLESQAAADGSSAAANEPVQPAAVAPEPDRLVEEFAVSRDGFVDRESVPTSKRSSQAMSNADDDWGYFNPQQVGFAALLEKLQEATD